MFQDKDGNYRGISIDILYYIAENEGWELFFVQGTWSECLERLYNGDIDIMPGIAYNEDRDHIFDFTQEDFASTWARIYSHSGSNLTNILSIKNKKIALLKRDILAENFSKLMTNFDIKYSPIYTNSYQEAAQLVQDGRADAGVFERISVIEIRKEYNIVETNIIFSPLRLLYAVGESRNTQLIQTIDRYLKDLKSDENSIYYKNLKRYFFVEEVVEAPLWLKVLMGALITLIVLFLGAIAYSRMQVKRKTKELTQKNSQLKQKIKERIRVEEELKSRNQFIEEILFNIPIAISVETLDFDFTSNRRLTNKNFKEIFGWDGKDFENLEDFLNRIFPNPKRKNEMFEKFISEVINGKSRVVKWEGEKVKTKHGDKFLTAIFILLKEQNLIILITQDVTEKIKAERQIKESLREKETLIKEIHHRVKNNMQVISSLLNLQTRYITDEHITQALEECRMRINSMSLIHENLYRNENLALINFHDYSNLLLEEIINSYNIDKNINLNLNIDSEILFDIETAIPCGLIINEITTNALKYAFDGRDYGNINLSLIKNDANNIKFNYTMEIGDDGVGIPDEIDIEKTKTLGLHLIRILVKQLKGKVELIRGNGTKYKVLFSKKKSKT
jgi:PAS domain S-box-containing protein